MIPPGPESMTGLRGQPPPRLVFGPFELDPGTGVLREGDRSIPLAAKPFELLLYLARSTFTDDAEFHRQLDLMTTRGEVWIRYGRLNRFDPGR